MIKKIAIIGICLLVGAGISYGVTYAVQISDLRSDIEGYESQVSNLKSDIEGYESQVSNLKSDIEGYKSQVSGLGSELARLEWTIQLMTDLQKDQTDEQQYVPGLYEDEYFARDLEDNLEELGYRVGYLVVFQYGSTLQPLQWETLVKVYYSNTFAVLVDPQTDRIVTTDYDGNRDGIVDTLLNPSVSEVSSRWDTLVSTGTGNDGKYLLLEFDDYDEVEFGYELPPPGQPQESTYEQEYAKLKSDLAEDKTDETKPKKDDYDCDDFARDLEKALEAKGYNVSIKCIYYYKGGQKVGHCIVNVHLRYFLISTAGQQQSYKMVAIEPQNKPCTEDVTDTYDDNKNGKIDSSWNPPKIDRQVAHKNLKETQKGNDGKYYIVEYDKFEDIPFPVDPGKLSPKEQAKQPK